MNPNQNHNRRGSQKSNLKNSRSPASASPSNSIQRPYFSHHPPSSASPEDVASSQARIPVGMKNPGGNQCLIYHDPSDYVVEHPIIQSHHKLVEQHSTPDTEIQEIVLAILDTCYGFRERPEMGNFVACRRKQFEDGQEPEQRWFMGVGERDKRKIKDLGREWASRHSPSSLHMMKLHAYQMIECYRCEGMMEIKMFGL